jgi:hypothetical protein
VGEATVATVEEVGEEIDLTRSAVGTLLLYYNP